MAVVALVVAMVAGACSHSQQLDEGDLLLEQGKPAEAIEVWQAALAEHPASTKLLIRIATAQSRLQRLDDAEATMRRAARIEPRSPRVWQNLGLVLFKQKRIEDALEAFQTCLDIQATYPETCYYVGLIHEMRGDEEAAERYYVRAVNQGPSRAWDNLILMKRRQREAGILPTPPRGGRIVTFSVVLLVLAACAYGLRLYLETRQERQRAWDVEAEAWPNESIRGGSDERPAEQGRKLC